MCCFLWLLHQATGHFFLSHVNRALCNTSCCVCEKVDHSCARDTGGTFDTLLLPTVIAESVGKQAPKLGSVAAVLPESVEESCSLPSYLSCLCPVAGDATENAREDEQQ